MSGSNTLLCLSDGDYLPQGEPGHKGSHRWVLEWPSFPGSLQLGHGSHHPHPPHPRTGDRVPLCCWHCPPGCWLSPAPAVGIFLCQMKGNAGCGSPRARPCQGLSPPADSTVTAGPGGHSAAGTAPSPQTLPPHSSIPGSSAGPEGHGATQLETQCPQGSLELGHGLSPAVPPPEPHPPPCWRTGTMHPKNTRGRPGKPLVFLGCILHLQAATGGN